MKQSLIQVRLEMLRVYALWLEVMAASVESRGRRTELAAWWQQPYSKAMTRERELIELCDESKSHRSKWHAVVLGVRLRCWFVIASRGQADEELVKKVKEEIGVQFGAVEHNADGYRVELDVEELKPLLQEVFHPTPFHQPMTTREKRSVQRAMTFAGGYGGRWYACPNGHPYVITECGRAMEESTCPECHAAIGGSEHELLESNTDAREYFAA